MRVLIKNRRGQFLVLTAFLVVVILSSAIIVSYKRIQENSFSNAVNLSSSMTDINNSISDLLGFTAGYYGSMIQVTGNATYAQMKTVEYLKSGLVTVAHSHVDWGTSFTLENVNIHTNWYNSTSSTDGDITVSYDIPSIGLMGAKFKTYASIKVQILETIGSQALVKVTVDKDRVDLSLLRSNFRFFKYDSSTNRWNYVELQSDPVVTTSGEYLLTIPAGINLKAYFLQVVDRRGIMVTAAYIKGVDTLNKKHISYTYTFSWPVEHDALPPADHTPVVVELLQDGTLRWLGEDLEMGGEASKLPFPPIPVKGIRVNATLKSDLTKSYEIPFQIEDWGSHYQVPYGITSNTAIFNENCMIVFLVNHTVDHVTVWWDGRDTAVQTPYATPTKFNYFANDDTSARHLSNGIINLDINLSGDGYVRASTTSGTPVNSEARFLRVNNRVPGNGAQESYIIYHGVVRDIVQQESEWGGGVTLSPNIFSHMVFTLPAKANYYTYQLRMIFVDSSQTRTLSDLSLIRLYGYIGSQKSEDGVSGVSPYQVPITSNSTTLYNGGTAYQHQWSQFQDPASGRGIGIMYTTSNNAQLYYFNSIPPGTNTGEILIDPANKKIELDPVKRATVNNFQQADDLTWKGAIVVTGDGKLPIYPTSGTTGLWILVEKLPTITVS
jgi:hypothetical protein